MVGHVTHYWDNFLTGDPERPLLLDLPPRELLLLQGSLASITASDGLILLEGRLIPARGIIFMPADESTEPDLGDGLLLGV